MRPILVFSKCACVVSETLSVQALFQKGFDGEFIYFEMRCLYCDMVEEIGIHIDDCKHIVRFEKEVMRFLSEEESDDILKLALLGKTCSIPREYNGNSLLVGGPQ